MQARGVRATPGQALCDSSGYHYLDVMSKAEERRIAALVKKLSGQAAKPKGDRRRQHDDTLPPDVTEKDLESRDFFSEMKKRDF